MLCARVHGVECGEKHACELPAQHATSVCLGLYGFGGPEAKAGRPSSKAVNNGHSHGQTTAARVVALSPDILQDRKDTLSEGGFRVFCPQVLVVPVIRSCQTRSDGLITCGHLHSQLQLQSHLQSHLKPKCTPRTSATTPEPFSRALIPTLSIPTLSVAPPQFTAHCVQRMCSTRMAPMHAPRRHHHELH